MRQRQWWIGQIVIAGLTIAIGLQAAQVHAVEVLGSSEGSIFGRPYAAISFDVKGTLPSRSGEPWYPTLALTVVNPPQLRPEGITFRNGLLYISGDWNETQNQIAVFNVNSWGDLVFHHAIAEPLSIPPPIAIPNTQWWGAEGLTFNTGATGIGAGGSSLVSVDNQQQAIGNTMAVISSTSGVVSGHRVVAYPEDICYAPAAQRFYLVVRSPNEVQAYDTNMIPLGISWALPSRGRGAVVVSESFGRFVTGDNSIIGEVILAVCAENTALIPPLPNRLVAYKLDGTPVGATQDLSWVDLSLDNGIGGVPGPHTFQGIAVDEANNVIYIADDSARAVYTLKPFLPISATTSGPIAGRTWLARGMDAKTVLPSRSSEAWFPALAASMSNPPRLAPEGLAFRNGELFASGDWNETQNQVAVFSAAADGTLTYNRAIQIPIPNPPPSPTTANNALWGPEGLTFNTSAAGYGASGTALVTVEDAQYLIPGNTRALLGPVTGTLSGFGVFSSIVGAASPDDIAFGPQSNRFYLIADPNVLQAWTTASPPAYANSQFALITRSKGLTVISASFTQFLLNDPTATQEHLLVVAKSLVQSTSAPHNRLAVYSTSGVLRAQQDLFWTRDAFPGAPLQEFEAIAVDEVNKVIYIGDEQAHGIFVLTPAPALTITTTSPLPNGTAGAFYSQSILASGGTPPYSFAVSTGTLPSEVMLSSAGTLAGTPAACASFGFTIQVSDSSVPQQVATKPFTIQVLPGPDSDGDGTADCLDGCPADPNKTMSGACGCGVSDVDSDGDGTPNCVDGCPSDANKIAPGACGCGLSELDTDGDGTPNCIDGCPLDPNKFTPGACGCGVSDVDSDSDGVPNCSDSCPADPLRTLPEICGCGFPVSDQQDTDNDGTRDCQDGCPNDPQKLVAGVCGCGIPDADADSDGVLNCLDGCPTDAQKSAPGQCGCGVTDSDSDGDAVSDCLDNCTTIPNTNQNDANANGVGDACEAGSGGTSPPPSPGPQPLNPPSTAPVVPPASSACGAGSCGATGTSLLPLTLAGLAALGHSRKQGKSKTYV
jgi:Putative Ig domain/Thrombospondin type 3 repeat